MTTYEQLNERFKDVKNFKKEVARATPKPKPVIKKPGDPWSGSSTVPPKVKSKPTSERAADKAKEIVKSKNPNVSSKVRDSNAKGLGTTRKRQAELERRRLDSKAKSDAPGNYEKRKTGFGGGIKKALGGDVIGMRGKKGETVADRDYRKGQTSKARADFAQKKVGQVGNAIKSAAKGTTQTKDLNPVDTKITAPQRGLYNPK